MTTTRTMNLTQLKGWSRNPRTISDSALAGLTRSIEEFGLVQPIIWNEQTGRVVGGHQRLQVLRRQGIEETEVIVVDLSPEREKALNVTLNNPEIAGVFTDDLGPLLREIESEDAELFEALMLDDLLDDDLVRDVVEDEAPGVDDDAEPITKPGDLWLLGDHRLLCGDSTKREDVERVMGGEKADAVVTDPPYGIGYGYNDHDDNESDWFDLMNKVVPMMIKMAKFVVLPSCKIARIGWWYENHKPDWMMCWFKGSPGHQSHVGFNDWEPHLVWGKPPKAMHDYWQTACGFEIDGHPCPKPVAYAAWLVERACVKSGVVFDPFLGSGTTIIAAEQTGRKCYGLEISPKYCDVIVKRWEQFTGQEATKESK